MAGKISRLKKCKKVNANSTEVSEADDGMRTLFGGWCLTLAHPRIEKLPRLVTGDSSFTSTPETTKGVSN